MSAARALLDEVAENRLLSRWAALLPRPSAQLGAIHEADAELLPLDDERLLALTLDTVSEELELGLFRSAETAGRVAATAALSDLAAVGADPLGLLLAVTLPAGSPEEAQAAVARGVGEVCRAAGVAVLGGDTGSGARLALTAAAIGTVPRSGLRTRVGASPGELVFASGPLGAGNALAAAALFGRPLPSCDERAFRPLPRLREGRALRGLATACIDTSDGLCAALDQLARLNGLGVAVEHELAALLCPAAVELGRELGVGALPFLAGQHGEFELVFTLPRDRLAALALVARELDWRPLALGRTVAGRGLTLNGRRLDGAAIRNLLAECGGEPRAYAEALCRLCCEGGRDGFLLDAQLQLL